MRNMRGAWGALLMAGAAYAWKNRDRLGQQLNSLRNQGTSRSNQRRQPSSLPDYNNTEQRDFNRSGTFNERELGGTNM